MNHLQANSENFPLTLPQQDIYYEQLLYPGSNIYNIGAKIQIKGHVDVICMKRAYNKLISENDAFRSIVIENDAPAISIIKEHKSELEFIDFSGSGNALEQAEAFMHESFKEVFDFSKQALLHKFILIKVDVVNYYLFSVYHHIITDGWGTSLMFQRLIRNYNEILESGEVADYCNFSYSDFTLNDLIYQESSEYVVNKSYWVEKYKDIPDRLLQLVISEKANPESERECLLIERTLYNKMIKLSDQYGVSVLHTIIGILCIYLGRRFSKKDISIGLPVLNRTNSKFKRTVGLFAGIAPLRVYLNPGNTFEQLLRTIKAQLRADYRHQRFPLGKLIKELNSQGKVENLFDITLSFERHDYSDNFMGTSTNVIPFSHNSERVALAIYVREFDDQEPVNIDFDYNLNFFDLFQIKQLISHFQNLMEEIIRNPAQRLMDFEYMSYGERNNILVEFNQTDKKLPDQTTIIDLFNNQVALRPDKIALQDASNKYSYAELERITNNFSYNIDKKLGENKEPLAVVLSRSAATVVTLLSILKSGRAFIPIDPSFPEERIAYILNHSEATTVIGNGKPFDSTDAGNVKIYEIDHFLKDVENNDEYHRAISPGDSAYIIYTSGSTGRPKGVEISHHSLFNFMTSMIENPGISPNDLLFSVTTYSFDISILEFFLPLSCGASVYVADKNILEEPAYLINEIERIGPTMIQATPSFFQMLFNSGWMGSRKLKILCGGDLLNVSLAEKLLESTDSVWNMYGPTETTIWSTIKKITSPNDAANIGTPINNTKVYILDQQLNIVPIGTAGSLYIGGEGLAIGYYKNDLLTQDKFIPSPFVHGEKIYTTGDIGRWNVDGEIEFLGREDNQVKIRGYRIELNEIQIHLLNLEGVNDAVVVAKKDIDGQLYLAAYIIAEDDNIETENCLKILKRKLPSYMLPRMIVRLEAFPLTPNKKIDRKKLAESEVDKSMFSPKDDVLPNKVEAKIIEIWRDLLDVKDIGVNDNLFFLGAHSLNLVKFSSIIKKEFNADLMLRELFDNPTIKDIATMLEKPTLQYKAISRTHLNDYCKTTFSQFKIWLISQRTKLSTAYNMSSVYRVVGDLNKGVMEASISKIIERHEILRSNFVEIQGNLKMKVRSPLDNVFAIKDRVVVNNTQLEVLIDEVKGQKFDLETGLLISIELIKCEDRDADFLVFCVQHIIMDEWSLANFMKELLFYYNSGLQQSTTNDNSPGIQFKDYTTWIDTQIEEFSDRHLKYWPEKFKNYKIIDDFQRDHHRSQFQNGAWASFELTALQTSLLIEIANKNNCSTFSALMTALVILIFNESNRNDICIGTVTSGRNHADLEDQIGLYAQTIPLRVFLRPELGFIDNLKTVHDEVLEAVEFQYSPMLDVLEEGNTDLFNTMILLKDRQLDLDDIHVADNLRLVKHPNPNKISRFPLVFNFQERDEILICDIEYNSNYYEAGTILLMIEHFKKVVAEITSRPKEPVFNYDLTLTVLDDVNDEKLSFGF